MTRLAGAVVGMATLALVLAYLVFGWPTLVLGVPLLVGITITVGVLVLFERPRTLRRDHTPSGSPWRTAVERGERPGNGLMSGFFELSPQAGAVPEQRPGPSTARSAGAR